MAEKEKIDLLMKFVKFGEQKAIPGEAMTKLPKVKSGMLKGFEENYMMELTGFKFKLGLGGTEGDVTSRQTQKAAEKSAADERARVQAQDQWARDLVLQSNREREKRNEPPLPLPTETKIKTPPKSFGFDKFRSGGNSESTRYPVDLKPIEFSRLVDRTSSTLMWHCVNRKPFKSATLIKRKAVGGPSSGEVFLRFDFHTVLLKSIEWANGTPIEEQIEFVCRGVTLTYKPQLPDGSLGDPIQKFWKSPLDANTSITQETLQGA